MEAGPSWQGGGCGRALGARAPRVAQPPSSFTWLPLCWACISMGRWACLIVVVGLGFSPRLALLRFLESALLLLFHLFSASISTIILFLLVQVETGQ
jgi:hypothetical protein